MSLYCASLNKRYVLNCVEIVNALQRISTRRFGFRQPMAEISTIVRRGTCLTAFRRRNWRRFLIICGHFGVSWRIAQLNKRGMNCSNHRKSSPPPTRNLKSFFPTLPVTSALLTTLKEHFSAIPRTALLMIATTCLESLIQRLCGIFMFILAHRFAAVICVSGHNTSNRFQFPPHRSRSAQP